MCKPHFLIQIYSIFFLEGHYFLDIQYVSLNKEDITEYHINVLMLDVPGSKSKICNTTLIMVLMLRWYLRTGCGRIKQNRYFWWRKKKLICDCFRCIQCLKEIKCQRLLRTCAPIWVTILYKYHDSYLVQQTKLIQQSISHRARIMLMHDNMKKNVLE